jgi:hypothetical protein
MNMIRGFRVAAASAALLPSLAIAQSTLENLGENQRAETLFLETKTIRSVEYPKRSVGSVIGEKATYRETWIKFVDKSGAIAGQSLWLFDCNGSAVVMASSMTSGSSEDRTAYAKSVGVEHLLNRIPPDSLYEVVQNRICKK